MTPRVLISDKLSPAAVDIFRERGIAVDYEPELSADKAAIAARIGDYDGLAVRSATKVTEKVLAAAKRLRVIGRAGIGVDNIDVAAATKKGIIVMNTPFGNSITTAEHAVALLFALVRFLERALDRGAQAPGVVLEYVVGRAHSDRLDRALLADRSRHEDERKVHAVLANHRQRPGPAEGRHGVVGDREIPLLPRERGGQRLGGIDALVYTPATGPLAPVPRRNTGLSTVNAFSRANFSKTERRFRRSALASSATARLIPYDRKNNRGPIFIAPHPYHPCTTQTP